MAGKGLGSRGAGQRVSSLTLVALIVTAIMSAPVTAQTGSVSGHADTLRIGLVADPHAGLEGWGGPGCRPTP
jgi:hypothetical protein